MTFISEIPNLDFYDSLSMLLKKSLFCLQRFLKAKAYEQAVSETRYIQHSVKLSTGKLGSVMGRICKKLAICNFKPSKRSLIRKSSAEGRTITSSLTQRQHF